METATGHEIFILMRSGKKMPLNVYIKACTQAINAERRKYAKALDFINNRGLNKEFKQFKNK